MSQRIKITAGAVTVEAELNDNPTAKAIAEVLPIKASAQRWGGEIYFTIALKAALEPDGREVLEAGELGFWPTGSAFCMFFGATPASNGDEIRAASAVNILGKMEGDLSGLWDVASGDEVLIEAM